jgi:hypothetical protein
VYRYRDAEYLVESAAPRTQTAPNQRRPTCGINQILGSEGAQVFAYSLASNLPCVTGSFDAQESPTFDDDSAALNGTPSQGISQYASFNDASTMLYCMSFPVRTPPRDDFRKISPNLYR